MLFEFQLRMQENFCCNICICPVEAMSCVLKMAYWCVVVIKTIVSNVSTAAFFIQFVHLRFTQSSVWLTAALSHILLFLCSIQTSSWADTLKIRRFSVAYRVTVLKMSEQSFLKIRSVNKFQAGALVSIWFITIMILSKGILC